MIGTYLLKQLNKLFVHNAYCDLEVISQDDTSAHIHELVFTAFNRRHLQVAITSSGHEKNRFSAKKMHLPILGTELVVFVQFMYGEFISTKSKYDCLVTALEKLDMTYLLDEAGEFVFYEEKDMIKTCKVNSSANSDFVIKAEPEDSLDSIESFREESIPEVARNIRFESLINVKRLSADEPSLHQKFLGKVVNIPSREDYSTNTDNACIKLEPVSQVQNCYDLEVSTVITGQQRVPEEKTSKYGINSMVDEFSTSDIVLKTEMLKELEEEESDSSCISDSLTENELDRTYKAIDMILCGYENDGFNNRNKQTSCTENKEDPEAVFSDTSEKDVNEEKHSEIEKAKKKDKNVFQQDPFKFPCEPLLGESSFPKFSAQNLHCLNSNSSYLVRRPIGQTLSCVESTCEATCNNQLQSSHNKNISSKPSKIVVQMLRSGPEKIPVNNISNRKSIFKVSRDLSMNSNSEILNGIAGTISQKQPNEIKLCSSKEQISSVGGDHEENCSKEIALTLDNKQNKLTDNMNKGIFQFNNTNNEEKIVQFNNTDLQEKERTMNKTQGNEKHNDPANIGAKAGAVTCILSLKPDFIKTMVTKYDASNVLQNNNCLKDYNSSEDNTLNLPPGDETYRKSLEEIGVLTPVKDVGVIKSLDMTVTTEKSRKHVNILSILNSPKSERSMPVGTGKPVHGNTMITVINKGASFEEPNNDLPKRCRKDANIIRPHKPIDEVFTSSVPPMSLKSAATTTTVSVRKSLKIMDTCKSVSDSTKIKLMKNKPSQCENNEGESKLFNADTNIQGNVGNGNLPNIDALKSVYIFHQATEEGNCQGPVTKKGIEEQDHLVLPKSDASCIPASEVIKLDLSQVSKTLLKKQMDSENKETVPRLNDINQSQSDNQSIGDSADVDHNLQQSKFHNIEQSGKTKVTSVGLTDNQKIKNSINGHNDVQQSEFLNITPSGKTKVSLIKLTKVRQRVKGKHKESNILMENMAGPVYKNSKVETAESYQSLEEKCVQAVDITTGDNSSGEIFEKRKVSDGLKINDNSQKDLKDLFTQKEHVLSEQKLKDTLDNVTEIKRKIEMIRARRSLFRKSVESDVNELANMHTEEGFKTDNCTTVAENECNGEVQSKNEAARNDTHDLEAVSDVVRENEKGETEKIHQNTEIAYQSDTSGVSVITTSITTMPVSRAVINGGIQFDQTRPILPMCLITPPRIALSPRPLGTPPNIILPKVPVTMIRFPVSFQNTGSPNKVQMCPMDSPVVTYLNYSANTNEKKNANSDTQEKGLKRKINTSEGLKKPCKERKTMKRSSSQENIATKNKTLNLKKRKRHKSEYILLEKRECAAGIESGKYQNDKEERKHCKQQKLKNKSQSHRDKEVISNPESNLRDVCKEASVTENNEPLETARKVCKFPEESREKCIVANCEPSHRDTTGVNIMPNTACVPIGIISGLENSNKDKAETYTCGKTIESKVGTCSRISDEESMQMSGDSYVNESRTEDRSKVKAGLVVERNLFSAMSYKSDIYSDFKETNMIESRTASTEKNEKVEEKKTDMLEFQKKNDKEESSKQCKTQNINTDCSVKMLSMFDTMVDNSVKSVKNPERKEDRKNMQKNNKCESNNDDSLNEKEKVELDNENQDNPEKVVQSDSDTEKNSELNDVAGQVALAKEKEKRIKIRERRIGAFMRGKNLEQSTVVKYPSEVSNLQMATYVKVPNTSSTFKLISDTNVCSSLDAQKVKPFNKSQELIDLTSELGPESSYLHKKQNSDSSKSCLTTGLALYWPKESSVFSSGASEVTGLVIKSTSKNTFLESSPIRRILARKATTPVLTGISVTSPSPVLASLLLAPAASATRTKLISLEVTTKSSCIPQEKSVSHDINVGVRQVVKDSMSGVSDNLDSQKHINFTAPNKTIPSQKGGSKSALGKTCVHSTGTKRTLKGKKLTSTPDGKANGIETLVFTHEDSITNSNAGKMITVASSPAMIMSPSVNVQGKVYRSILPKPLINLNVNTNNQ